MKIAVMADIHSNHIALEKCVRQAQRLGADEFLFLGDYVGDLAYPQKTLKYLEKLRSEVPCTFIRGNKEDYWIDYRQADHDEWEWKPGTSNTGMLRYGFDRITDSQIDEFEKMPISMVIEREGMPPFTICHGSPFSATESMREGNDYIDELTEKLESELTICAHFHIQMQYVRNGKRVINPGSVGLSFRCGGKAQFMMLHGNDGRWEPEFISLPYEVEEVIREMDEEKLWKHAPAWYQVTRSIILGGDVSQGKILKKAFELCEKAEGFAQWGKIPEKYWDMALDSYSIPIAEPVMD
ncbi:metallophosphoesterase [Butyrivibrio sp. INlla16]|uniref:metallophosphoesterase family protein n=1 Tax=Butyrivibrio sp. INlla16 TaxID=1520807 RepID=UPI000888C116|nr:metallophosphoesterase family protein [Butyrivibrio sp. INlla16]SDB24062.1 phosphoesterase, MJ0936 family [Butyrivibrio sp. INlla16]